MRYIRQDKISQQHGITLIEVLIAMTILLGLISGALSYYSIHQTAVNDTITKHTLEQKAVSALSYISDAIQTAGYSGCAGIYSQQRQAFFNAAFPSEFHIRDKNGAWEPQINPTYIRPKDSHSNALLVQYTQTQPKHIKAAINKNTLNTESAHELEVNDWIWLTNCQFSVIAKVSNIISDKSLSISQKTYQQQNNTAIKFIPQAGDRLYKINWYYYYLDKDASNNHVLTLYLKKNQSPAAPLVAGITQLQFHQANNNQSLIISLTAESSDIKTKSYTQDRLLHITNRQ